MIWMRGERSDIRRSVIVEIRTHGKTVPHSVGGRIRIGKTIWDAIASQRALANRM